MSLHLNKNRFKRRCNEYIYNDVESGYNYKQVYGKECKETVDYVQFAPIKFEDAEELEATYHALCPNCQRIIKTEEDLEKYKDQEQTVDFCGGLTMLKLDD